MEMECTFTYTSLSGPHGALQAALHPPRAPAPALFPDLNLESLHLPYPQPPAFTPHLCIPDNPLILHYHPFSHFAFFMEYLEIILPFGIPFICSSNLTPASLLGMWDSSGPRPAFQTTYITPDSDQDTSGE